MQVARASGASKFKDRYNPRVSATVRCSCGQAFWVSDAEVGTRVLCPTCGLEIVASGEEGSAPAREPVEEKVPVPERITCRLCEADGAVPVEMMRVVSFVVITSPKRWRETLCPGCARQRLLVETMITTFCGWWGLPFGPVFTPLAIALNLRSLARHSDLPGALGVFAGLLVASMPLITVALLVAWLPDEPSPATTADSVTDVIARQAEQAAKAGQVAEAAGWYEEVLLRQPDRPGLRLAAAAAFLKANRHRDVLRHLKPIDSDAAAKLLLAEALLALARPVDALALLPEDRVELRAPALARIGEFARAAKLEPAGPRSAAAITKARVSLPVPDWAGARRSATTAQAQVILWRALGCARSAERVAAGDDAAWLALDRGDLEEARRLATTSPWGAVAHSIADRIDGREGRVLMAPGDDEPHVRTIARAMTSPASAAVMILSMPKMTMEERWAAELVLALLERDSDRDASRRRLRTAGSTPNETPGRELAGRLLGEEFDDPYGRK